MYLPLRAERAEFFIFTLKITLSGKKERQVAVGSNETSAYPERSSTVALSCQGPVAQSPISQLSGLMSVLSLVVHKAGCSKRLEAPSPPQAAGKEPAPDVSARPRAPWRVGRARGPLIAPCMGSVF